MTFFIELWERKIVICSVLVLLSSCDAGNSHCRILGANGGGNALKVAAVLHFSLFLDGYLAFFQLSLISEFILPQDCVNLIYYTKQQVKNRTTMELNKYQSLL